jgi:hypothetical protein
MLSNTILAYLNSEQRTITNERIDASEPIIYRIVSIFTSEALLWLSLSESERPEPQKYFRN